MTETKSDTSPTLRISCVEDTKILFEALKPERFEIYGFGTFLCDIDPKEVSITRQALEVLLNCPYRSGVQAVEIWGENRIAWGAKSCSFKIEPLYICREPESKKWLEKCHIE